MLNTRVHQSEVSMATDTPRIPEQGVATLPDEAWERARRRAEIISPLAQSAKIHTISILETQPMKTAATQMTR